MWKAEELMKKRLVTVTDYFFRNDASGYDQLISKQTQELPNFYQAMCKCVEKLLIAPIADFKMNKQII